MGADSTPDLAGFTGMGFTGMGSRERLASLVIPNWQSTLLARASANPSAPIARAYDRHLFNGGTPTLQDLPDRPRFVINATNQQSGAVWRFSKPYMRDWRVGEVARPRLAVSLAVETSSAFPRFLSPLFPCSTLGSRRRKSPPALADARAPVPSRSLRRRAALAVG
jgi:hypothetical protein